MKRKVNQVRDLAIIEKELETAEVGALAFSDVKEKVVQFVTPFIYVDKNIYVYLDGTDEIYEKMVFENSVSFTIFKNNSRTEDPDLEFPPSYRFLQITVNGTVKKIEETKTIEEIHKIYLQKYPVKANNEENSLYSGEKLIIVDTEEIQASENYGS